MALTRKVEKALKDAGAILVRDSRHFVYRLPNNRIVTLSQSPSCPFVEKKQLKDIERTAKLC